MDRLERGAAWTLDDRGEKEGANRKSDQTVRDAAALGRRTSGSRRAPSPPTRDRAGHLKSADNALRGEIGHKTAALGIPVTAVEIREVSIPEALQDAMSRQAQAEREKKARIILGSEKPFVGSATQAVLLDSLLSSVGLVAKARERVLRLFSAPA